MFLQTHQHPKYTSKRKNYKSQKHYCRYIDPLITQQHHHHNNQIYNQYLNKINQCNPLHQLTNYNYLSNAQSHFNFTYRSTIQVQQINPKDLQRAFSINKAKLLNRYQMNQKIATRYNSFKKVEGQKKKETKLKQSMCKIFKVKTNTKQNTKRKYQQPKQKLVKQIKVQIQIPKIKCNSYACTTLPIKNNDIQPIASLTKIMTLYLCLQLIQNQEDYIQIIPSDKVGGTTAQLNIGDKILIKYAYFALMLPSGNQVANALARKCKGKIKKFVKCMNQKCNILGLKKTKFSNPHGLGKSNISCVSDLLRLCQESIKNQKFLQIVSTKQFQCQIKDSENNTKLKKWKNTNKLLQIDGFLGIKTGYTPSAGPCLASLYKKQGQCFISIILGSFSMQGRFSQSLKLINHVLQHKSIKIQYS